MTPVLKVLKASPQEITGGCMVVLERFVVPIYDLTSSLRNIRLGVATAQQFIVTILDSSTTSKGILSRTHSMWMQSLM